MATEGIEGLYVETRDYAATTAFWASLGYRSDFETEHRSGQWAHPAGGPWLFIAEQHDHELETYPVLGVADSRDFASTQPAALIREFEPQHWGVVEALIRDPDGRTVSLQAPLPAGVEAPDTDTHHLDKYGTT